MATHFLFLSGLATNPVSRLTAGDLADLPPVCAGEDSGLRRATGYVLVGDDTGQRHKETVVEVGKKSRAEVRGISVNLIPQCLDVFKIYCNSIQGTQCLLVVF